MLQNPKCHSIFWNTDSSKNENRTVKSRRSEGISGTLIEWYAIQVWITIGICIRGERIVPEAKKKALVDVERDGGESGEYEGYVVVSRLKRNIYRAQRFEGEGS